MKKDPPLLTLPAAKRICMQESIKQYEQFVSHNPAVNAVFNHPTLKETMQPYLGYNGLLALRSSHRYFKDFPWRVGLTTGSEYTQSKILATLLQQPIPNADNAARLLEIILPYKKSLKRKIFHTDEFISDSREMFNLPIVDRRLMFNITLAYLLIIRLKKVSGDVVGVELYKKKLNHYYRGDKLAKKILSELNESQLLEVESEIFQFVHLMCVNNPYSDELVGNDDLTTLQVVFAHEYASYYKFESPRTLFKKHQQKVNIFKLLILHPNFNKEPLVLRFLELMNSSDTHEYGKPVIAYYISEIIKYCCNDVLLQKYFRLFIRNCVDLEIPLTSETILNCHDCYSMLSSSEMIPVEMIINMEFLSKKHLEMSKSVIDGLRVRNPDHDIFQFECFLTESCYYLPDATRNAFLDTLPNEWLREDNDAVCFATMLHNLGKKLITQPKLMELLIEWSQHSIIEDIRYACEFAFIMLGNLVRRLPGTENSEKLHSCVHLIFTNYINEITTTQFPSDPTGHDAELSIIFYKYLQSSQPSEKVLLDLYQLFLSVFSENSYASAVNKIAFSKMMIILISYLPENNRSHLLNADLIDSACLACSDDQDVNDKIECILRERGALLGIQLSTLVVEDAKQFHKAL